MCSCLPATLARGLASSGEGHLPAGGACRAGSCRGLTASEECLCRAFLTIAIALPLNIMFKTQ
jgi:hypothetical protein